MFAGTHLMASSSRKLVSQEIRIREERISGVKM
jgi:hypothetical protein